MLIVYVLLLRDEGIPYSSIRKTDNYGVEIRFRNADDRSKASDYLARRNRRSSFLEMGIITR